MNMQAQFPIYKSPAFVHNLPTRKQCESSYPVSLRSYLVFSFRLSLCLRTHFFSLVFPTQICLKNISHASYVPRQSHYVCWANLSGRAV